MIDTLFDEWDVDGSGALEFKELRKLLRGPTTSHGGPATADAAHAKPPPPLKLTPRSAEVREALETLRSCREIAAENVHAHQSPRAARAVHAAERAAERQAQRSHAAAGPAGSGPHYSTRGYGAYFAPTTRFSKPSRPLSARATPAGWI